MRRFFLCLALLSNYAIWLSERAEAQKVHALVVGDLSPSAGWGEYSSNLTMDMTNMFVFFHANLPISNLGYRSIEIKEDRESDPNFLLSELRNLSPSPDDTVFFYYSGHGSVDDKGHHLALARGKLYRQTIIDTLQNKKPRLVVLITDCCNSRSDGRSFLAPAPYYETPKEITPLLKSLIMEPKGIVDINSSSPGESAFFIRKGEDKFQLPGSIFTTELSNWTSNRLDQRQSWDDLVRGVSLQVHSSFQVNYPKGAQVAMGQIVQNQQTLYAISYPGKPDNEGPRTGIIIRDFEGRGVVIVSITPGSPATQVYDIANKQLVSLQVQQVLISANGRPISKVEDMSKIISESPQIMRIRIRDAQRGDHEYLLRMRY